mmetsp:Transcript_21695/g.35790  ORF Transcript_21695/g.35790 Transcript_21695/m.35790 type:complete len:284 (-) Transcript_21695:233-1084(-)|eukprot:CAMPEP_0119309468 /NCGR_PEP_ID=MMETSP1333-20130426/15785_1 /TAXON_ID=418940 /ORGANISM="Scyphosphaera apsteinii, Strain RCC1455" /LENGTH=283 /DNA_ID=CAMNT_0007313455 /DNA_START=56 /DNA_END=907 /DNA_ORIENTATION=+
MKKGFLGDATKPPKPKAAKPADEATTQAAERTLPRTSADPAIHPRSIAFFNTLTDAQRDMLASMGSMTAQERSELGNALVATAVASQSTANASSALENLRAAGGTGPAFVSFGERAVVHRYISQQQLERIAVRLTSYPTAEAREAETVKAMRRFIACRQPLSDVRLVGCPVRHKMAPAVDLNGLKARMDVMSSMPGGTPERYNVNVKLPADGDDSDDGDEPNHIVVVEPKHLRPCPLAEDFRDQYHEKIPEDHAAEAWWAEQEEHYQKMQRMGMGFRGPPRPS